MDVTGQRVDISLLHEKKSHGGDGQTIDTVEAFGKVKDQQHRATASHMEMLKGYTRTFFFSVCCLYQEHFPT